MYCVCSCRFTPTRLILFVVFNQTTSAVKLIKLILVLMQYYTQFFSKFQLMYDIITLALQYLNTLHSQVVILI